MPALPTWYRMLGGAGCADDAGRCDIMKLLHMYEYRREGITHGGWKESRRREKT